MLKLFYILIILSCNTTTNENGGDLQSQSDGNIFLKVDFFMDRSKKWGTFFVFGPKIIFYVSTWPFFAATFTLEVKTLKCFKYLSIQRAFKTYGEYMISSGQSA